MGQDETKPPVLDYQTPGKPKYPWERIVGIIVLALVVGLFLLVLLAILVSGLRVL